MLLLQLNDLFVDTKHELEETSKELEETGKELSATKDDLRETTSQLCQMTDDRNEQKHLVAVHVKTESKLHSQATQVLQLYWHFLDFFMSTCSKLFHYFKTG